MAYKKDQPVFPSSHIVLKAVKIQDDQQGGQGGMECHCFFFFKEKTMSPQPFKGEINEKRKYQKLKRSGP